jgi:hypothetical protein
LTRRFLVERGVMYLHTLIQVFNSGYQRWIYFKKL